MSFKNRKEMQNWYVVDATNKPVGRIATLIATRLQGKHKPEYLPHQDVGDYIVVINTKDIVLTGHKWFDKKYYTHSGYPGGLKEMNAAEMYQKKPTKILELAVKGMLPKNKMRGVFMDKLKVYFDDKHPHEGQKPEALEI